MQYDFPAEYSQRTDGELLHLVSSRHSLVPEAAVALDAELHRRNLNESDRIEHRRHFKRQERLETKKRRRFTFGIFKDRMTWRDILGGFGVIAILVSGYFALPRSFHLQSEWQDAAMFTMMTSVFIVAASRRELLRNLIFWMSLAIACAINLTAAHACTKRIPGFNGAQARGAMVIEFLVFVGVYKFISVLQRNFYGKEQAITDKVMDGEKGHAQQIT